MSAKLANPFSFPPGIQSLIPLFYAAWADRVLSPSEARLLSQEARQFSFLQAQDLSLLKEWANMSAPPPRDLFKFWEMQMKEISRELPQDQAISLVDIGLELARRAAVENKETSVDWTSAAVRKELEKIETGLKQIRLETYRQIFPRYGGQTEALVLAPTRFDVAAMQALLDGPQSEVKRKVRTLLTDPIFRYRNLRRKEDYREQVLIWCKLLAKQGLGALYLPAQYGGVDSMEQYLAAFETLGFHDLSLAVKFGVQFGLFGGSILWLGTEKHHKKYLEAMGKLDLPGCFAMTETGHGSNVRGLETTATYDAETQEFIVHTPNREARKEYIGNALHGRLATVFTQLVVDNHSHGVHALLVPLRGEDGNLKAGVGVEDCGYKMGLNGVDNGLIWFDQVRVPRENLLNRFGDVGADGAYSSPIQNPSKRFFTMLGTLVGGRVGVARIGLSAAKSGLTIAIRYALKRRQFAPSFNEEETLLLDYPSHQRRLMPLLAKTYALDFALAYLVKRYGRRSEADIREIETLAAGLKSCATWFTTRTLQECREACGGKGYLAENRLADLKADSDIFTTFEGDNTVLMQLVAKGVLSEFRQEFHDEGFVAVLRLLGKRLSVSITERNPIVIRRTDREHLLDAQFHVAAFRYRQSRLLYSLAQRIRGGVKSGLGSYKAFLQCQTHSLALAEAFIDLIVLEQFMEVVEAQTDEKLKEILKKLCDLYALHTIEQNKGWFLEQDYLSGQKSKAIRRLVNELCGELRKDAEALVAAFAIPEACLAAPII